MSSRAFLLACVALAFIAFCGASSMEDIQIPYERDMEDERLAVEGAGQVHRFGCSDLGVWKGSCDIDVSGNVIQPADWSTNCDPWKDGKFANATNFSHGTWTCPEQYRSESGCGDMRTDPRNLTCEAKLSLDLTSTERILIAVGEPMLPQKHVCVQRPIFYDNMNTAGKVTPPIVGRHRERWAKWGEYEYIPPQRWLHNIEHGGIAFLYDHCLDDESLCIIRRFIKKWQKWMDAGKMDGGKFRFILTPFNKLQRGLALVSWGELYMSKGFNEDELDLFIKNYYRRAWEDYAPDGPYDFLWTNISTKDTTCSAPQGETQWDPSVVQQKYDISAMATPTIDAIELMQLREEQRTLRGLTVVALVVSAACFLAFAVVLLWLRSTAKRMHILQDEESESVTHSPETDA